MQRGLGNMRILVALAATLLLATSAVAMPLPRTGSAALWQEGPDQPVSEWERPWFCHNLDCPRFTVVNATDDYEVRTRSSGSAVFCCTALDLVFLESLAQVRYYEAGVWASTDVEAYAYALAVNIGFKVGSPCPRCRALPGAVPGLASLQNHPPIPLCCSACLATSKGRTKRPRKSP